jgi:hypothetical protein
MKKSFFGVLPHFNFNKIFFKRKPKGIYIEEDDYFDQSPMWGFGNFYIHKKMEYHLEPEIYEQMYLRDEEYIKNNSQVDYHLNEIEYEVKSEKNIDAKYSILQNYYNFYKSKINKANYDDDYALFQNKEQSFGLQNFYEYYVEEFDASFSYIGISKFLNGEISFYQLTIKKMWELFHLVREVCHYCLVEMKKLDKQNLQIFKEYELLPIELKIFKDDGLAVFKTICEFYYQKKNPAFFSYLYSFLKKTNKLHNVDGDNKSYRMYVKETQNIIGFTRIIETKSLVSNTQIAMHNCFEEILNTYPKINLN